MKFDKILYGGDYNPEQWLKYPEILKKDIELMKEAEINTVSLGIFAWSALEPSENSFTIDWMEEIINCLFENGISVILATPSGARPKWLSDKYPEVLRVREDRGRNLFGARHNHCYTSPIYREKVKIINTKLAEKFAGHKGVIMWHISNEYGGECHCPICQKAFQEWLQKKYQTIDEVNDRWCTAFWSHRYNSFSQIESPSSIGENAVHGLTLDWKRFVTEQTADFAEEEIKALKAAGARQPVTANMMYDFAGLNYDRLAEIVDIISWDTYPQWHKYEDILVAMDNGMQHDYMRSLKHKPFLLMESCPSSTNWQGVSKLKKPGLLTAAAFQAVAHGSESVLYFQIRQSQGSSEKFHGAVIDHYGGNDTRVFKEVKAIGEKLSEIPEISGSKTKSEAAIIYDVENRWAVEDSQGPRNKGMFYHQAVQKSYNALKKQGINIDVISEAQDISNYKIVVCPMLYLFRDSIEEKIKTFVENGGTFIMSYWSGIVDENDRCFLGGTPHGLQEVFGLRRTETDGLYDWESNCFVPKRGSGLERNYECKILCDLVQVTTAEGLMEYGEDFYAGTPALTKNKYKNGLAYYICADAEQDFYDDFYKNVLSESEVSPIVEGEVPAGIEINSRYTDNAEYIFIQNYRNEKVSLKGLRIDGDILYGRDKEYLKAYETLLVKA